MKLLTIINSLSMGGAEHMAYELIKQLDRSQFDPYVLCYDNKYNTPLEQAMEKICQVKYLGQKGKITPITVFRVLRAINEVKPDIVHAHLGGVTFAVPWCFMHRVPLVVTVHTTPEQAFSKKNEALIRFAFRKCCFCLVAVSEENYIKVKSYYRINDQRITYVNNGIDTEKYYRKPHKTFTFINVARQDENKNQAVIIEAFKKIHDEYKNTLLILVGDGPCHKDLIRKVNKMGLNEAVSIPGITGTPEDYYAISDVYVQSSHREAMPLSVLEAMAAGLPIIATNVGGLKDVVKDNGILVSDGDEYKLYLAMKQLLFCNSEQYEYMKNVSKQIADSYSSKRMAESYEKIYKNLLQ